MNQPLKRAEVQSINLQMDLLALLKRLGPCHRDDLRERLCVASHSRYLRAVAALVASRVCERVGRSLRLVGDTRPVPSCRGAWR